MLESQLDAPVRVPFSSGMAKNIEQLKVTSGCLWEWGNNSFSQEWILKLT